MPPENREGAMRVATQYFKGDARVCELACTGHVLGIHISPPTEGGWTAEGHSHHGDGAIVLVGHGASRSAALRDLGEVWTRNAGELGLVRFDWKDVADVLRNVKAID
jgi:hypothetical protein